MDKINQSNSQLQLMDHMPNSFEDLPDNGRTNLSRNEIEPLNDHVGGNEINEIQMGKYLIYY